MTPEDDRVWLGKPTWPFAPACTTKRSVGLPPACGPAPETSRSWRKAQLGRGDQPRDGGLGSPDAPAGRGVDSGASPEVGGLAGLAARDRASERRALERLIAADPADFAALKRLAELAVEQGQPGRAAELRRQKTEMDTLQARYQKLYEQNQPLRDAAEMARLAERLGRRFEARVFGTVAVVVGLDCDDLRATSPSWTGVTKRSRERHAAWPRCSRPSRAPRPTRPRPRRFMTSTSRPHGPRHPVSPRTGIGSLGLTPSQSRFAGDIFGLLNP